MADLTRHLLLPLRCVRMNKACGAVSAYEDYWHSVGTPVTQIDANAHNMLDTMPMQRP